MWVCGGGVDVCVVGGGGRCGCVWWGVDVGVWWGG